MTKREFNKVLTELFKQRKIDGDFGYYHLADRYEVFINKDGSYWNENGKCTDEEWVIELHYIPPLFKDKDDPQKWYLNLAKTLDNAKISPSLDVYLNNANDYTVIEIEC